MPSPRDKWPSAESELNAEPRASDAPASAPSKPRAAVPRSGPSGAGFPSRRPPTNARGEPDTSQRPTPVVGPPQPRGAGAPQGYPSTMGTMGPEPEFTFGGEFDVPRMPALDEPWPAEATRPADQSVEDLNWDDLSDFPMDKPAPQIPGPPRTPSGTGFNAVETREFGEPPRRPTHEPALLDSDPGDALSLVDRASLLPPAIVPDPRRELHDRYALGDFSGALVIADALLAEQPGDDEAAAIAEECRSRLRQMYASRIGDFGHVPVMVVPRSELKWLSLDHRAGFVLSLVDGASSIEEILDVAGMPVLEVLRTLYNLLTQRIIEVKPRGSRR